MCSVKPLSASPGFWMRELTTRRSRPFSPASSSRRRSKSRSLTSCSTLIESMQAISVTEREPALYSCLLVLGVLFRDQPEDARRALGVQDRLPELRLLEQARDPRQRFEVKAGRVVRREEHEKEVGGLSVDRREVHSPALASEGGEQPGKPSDLPVRDGDAFADSGGPELLALEQRIGELLRREGGIRAGEPVAELAEHTRL